MLRRLWYRFYFPIILHPSKLYVVHLLIYLFSIYLYTYLFIHLLVNLHTVLIYLPYFIPIFFVNGFFYRIAYYSLIHHKLIKVSVKPGLIFGKFVHINI